MQILSLNNYSYYNSNSKPSFWGHGKPITLQYIVKNRSNILPQIILEKAKSALRNTSNRIPTLMEIHLERYAPLKDCKTMQEVITKFPEFANIKENPFIRKHLEKKLMKISF